MYQCYKDSESLKRRKGGTEFKTAYFDGFINFYRQHIPHITIKSNFSSYLPSIVFSNSHKNGTENKNTFISYM